MIFRTRILITAVGLCHLLQAHSLITGRTLPTASDAGSPFPSAPSSQAGEPVTLRAVQQEKDGDVYKLRGASEIHYRDYILHADEVTYNSATDDTIVEGHVVLDGGPYAEHVEASHGTYNIRTEVGTFYSVIGTIGFRGHRSRFTLATSSPFAFTGKVVEKHGPGHYLVRHGTVTTCELPHPKWRFDANRVVVDVDGTATIYRSNFQLKGVPILYFPYATHPVQKEQRQSGFLIPSIGNSSSKGFIVGDSAYWAINRSMDATVGAEYFSLRGWAQHGLFRARPSDTSYVSLYYFGVLDRGIGSPPQKQGGEEVRLNAEGRFGHNFRGVANVDYLSSFVFRIAFNEVYTEAINSEVKSQVYLSNSTNGFNSNALLERYQDFEAGAVQQTELVRILHTPSFLLTGIERPIGHTPLYWSFDSAAEGLQRRELGFITSSLVGRFDLAPTISMPFQWQGWSVRPELKLRETFYTEQAGTVARALGMAAQDPINRKALEASFELRPPALSKVFDKPWLGRKWKHVIEPRMRYDYVTGVNNFANIIRFDVRDVLSNTSEIEYGAINRIYSRRIKPGEKDCVPANTSRLIVGGAAQPSSVPWETTENTTPPPCSSAAREVISWELAQKYFFDPTFGGALVTGQRNVFSTTADFTGIAFLNSPRRFSPIISRLRIATSSSTNTEWDVDYDPVTGRLNASTALLNYHYGQFTVGGGDAFLRVNSSSLGGATSPGAPDFHQFRFNLGYGGSQKRGLSGAASFGFDAEQGVLQYSVLQTSYNWDCCGFNFEYRRFALGAVRNENQFRFAFSLANVGAFGNLRPRERLY